MAKGTIYWDESSRGYNDSPARNPHKRGRWVGEKFINGRRVRMRSTDYNRVLEWLGEVPEDCRCMVPLKGFPKIKFNCKTGQVIGVFGRPLKPSKGVVSLYRDGRRMYFSVNKIKYAVLHDIDVSHIPSSLVVVEDGKGGVKLQERKQLPEHANQVHKEQMTVIIQQRSREVEMLSRYYKSGNSSEIELYAMERTDALVIYMMSRFNLSKQRATDIAAEVVERFCRRARDRNLAVTSITFCLRDDCRNVYRRDNNKRIFDDNLLIDKFL